MLPDWETLILEAKDMGFTVEEVREILEQLKQQQEEIK